MIVKRFECVKLHARKWFILHTRRCNFYTSGLLTSRIVEGISVGTKPVKFFPAICQAMIIWLISQIEEYSAIRGSSPIWFISRKMAKQDFVYRCWQWPAVTLKWLLLILWISHHYKTFTECRNEDSVSRNWH